jgi:hypothetical protein
VPHRGRGGHIQSETTVLTRRTYIKSDGSAKRLCCSGSEHKHALAVGVFRHHNMSFEEEIVRIPTSRKSKITGDA